MNQNLHFWDPGRWLFGQTPAWFLIEVFGRAVLIYIALQVILRLMGRRMASQMSTAELAVVVTLGAAIGVPMEAPDRGMLAGILILVLALFFQRGLAWLTFRYRRAEILSVGDVALLVEDGRILLDIMEKMVLSRERLFAVLRTEGIEHLGQIRRVYVEATGDFSIYQFKKVSPGLSVLPVFDEKLRNLARAVQGQFVCFSCGAKREAEKKPTDACPHCGNTHWTEAVVGVDEEAPTPPPPERSPEQENL